MKWVRVIECVCIERRQVLGASPVDMYSMKLSHCIYGWYGLATIIYPVELISSCFVNHQ